LSKVEVRGSDGGILGKTVGSDGGILGKTVGSDGGILGKTAFHELVVGIIGLHEYRRYSFMQCLGS
jgi:hypothetical protein